MIKKIATYLIMIMISTISVAQERQIAITIDDLPFVGFCNNNPAKLQRASERFNRILQTLVDNQIPATGFVIAGAIEKGQWELLEQFKGAGLSLGNHTYSHQSLDRLTAEKYIDDVDRADKILTPLFAERKYFRYPYLAESHGKKRQAVYDYLAAHHYVIAPVTIDTKDFLFNKQLFSIPFRMRDKNLPRLKERYLAYITRQAVRAEQEAAQHPDAPAKEILLLHANLLNSHFLGDVIELFKQRGYRFISLEEALR